MPRLACEGWDGTIGSRASCLTSCPPPFPDAVPEGNIVVVSIEPSILEFFMTSKLERAKLVKSIEVVVEENGFGSWQVRIAQAWN